MLQKIFVILAFVVGLNTGAEAHSSRSDAYTPEQITTLGKTCWIGMKDLEEGSKATLEVSASCLIFVLGAHRDNEDHQTLWKLLEEI